MDVLANAYRECFAEHLYLVHGSVNDQTWEQLDKATRDVYRRRADSEVDRYA